MAKIAFFVVFALAVAVSIQCVVGDDLFTPEQVDKLKSDVKDAAKTVSNAAGDAKDNVEDTSATWTNWAKDQLRDFGLLSPKETMSGVSGPDSASTPESSPASSTGYSSSSYSEVPAAAPAS